MVANFVQAIAGQFVYQLNMRFLRRGLGSRYLIGGHVDTRSLGTDLVIGETSVCAVTERRIIGMLADTQVGLLVFIRVDHARCELRAHM